MTLRRAQVDDDPQTSTASGPVAWSDIVFTSNTECSYVDPVSGGTWGVTIRTQADDTIRVTWTADAATKATASVTCPDSPVIPGQPGPRPLGVEPVSFVLPAAGGTQPISGSVTSDSGGFYTDGTIVVTPPTTEPARRRTRAPRRAQTTSGGGRRWRVKSWWALPQSTSTCDNAPSVPSSSPAYGSSP